MGYQRRRRKASESQSTFALNITSMTDMFTIMLVFLLQSYSTSEVVIAPEKDVSLPISNVQTNPIPAVKVSMSRHELKVGDRTIASLTEGDFKADDIEKTDANFIKPLFAELEKIGKESQKPEDKEGRVLLMADSSLNYNVLRKVMYTASMAGFPKLKMATVVGD